MEDAIMDLIILSATLLLMDYTHAEIIFSRGVAAKATLRLLPGCSLESCIQECRARNLCEQALYHRASKVCRLNKAKNSNVDRVTSGTVLLAGFAGDRMTDPSCGQHLCNHLETCVKENGEFTCKVTECGIVSSAFYETNGNMYQVDSKLRVDYVGTGKRTTITCGQDGRWVGENFEGCCHAGCTSGLAAWPRTWNPYYCDMETTDGKWVVFQRRKDGSENFRRNWADYENGFGNLEEEFWLGLRRIYNLLAKGDYELRVDLEDFNGNKVYAHYSNFSITGEDDNYRLNVSGFSGSAGDSLNVHNGFVFTTIDKDGPSNCANKYNGGWWYTNCHYSNLNGLYYNGGGTTPTEGYIHWATWLGWSTSLKSTEMKLRKLS